MDPGQKDGLGHLQKAALEPGSAQALGPWVLRIGGGLAEAGEETWKGAWTDCPSCTLGTLEEAGPPSPGTAPLTAAHQSPLCIVRLPLGTTPRATAGAELRALTSLLPSAGLSCPQWAFT